MAITSCERAGPIRFVGGPWHNRLYTLREWPRRIYVPEPRPVFTWDPLPESIVDAVYVTNLAYEFVELVTPGGAEFYEYWLAGTVPSPRSPATDRLNLYDQVRYLMMDPHRG